MLRPRLRLRMQGAQMKVDDVIALATARTEQRGAKVLNLYNELLVVVQDFCAAKPWPWRKKLYAFNTTAEQPLYALPTQGTGGGSQCDVDEIENVQIVTGADDADLLDEIVSEIDQARRQTVDSSDKPDSYFRKLGDYTKLILSPTPDDAYPMVLLYWATPVDALVTGADVPLVPPQLHGTLVKGLEAFILRYTLGEESSKYMNAKSEYDAKVAQAWGA